MNELGGVICPDVGFPGAAMMKQNRPVDITALSLFFAFGAAMCAAAALMIYSSGALHSIWKLVPAIATMGTEAVSWLVLVSIACFVAAFGLWRISHWGFFAASMLLMLGLIAHFWRAIATADWSRLSIVVTLGVLVGFYLRSRAALFDHRAP
jgi:ABC-type enterochelin transport system permease subunit